MIRWNTAPRVCQHSRLWRGCGVCLQDEAVSDVVFTFNWLKGCFVCLCIEMGFSGSGLCRLHCVLQGSIQGDIAVLQGIVPVEAQVAELTAERKILVGGNYRDKHFATGSAILAVGVTSAILAPVNTYLRVGML